MHRRSEWTGSRFYSDHHPDADPDRLRIQLSIGKNDAKQTLGELVAARNKLADAGTLTAEQEAILFDNAYKTLCAHGRNNDLREEVVTSLHPDSVIIEKVTFLAEHRKVFVLPQTLQKPLQDVDEALKWKNIDIERLDNFKLSGKYRSRTGDAARDCIPNETEVAIDFVTSERLALGMKWDNKDAVTGELDQNQAFRNLIREVNQTEIKLMIYNDANRNGLSLHEVIDYYTSIDQKTKKSCLIQDDEHEVHLLFDNAANQGLDYEGNPLSDNDVKLNEASRLLPRQLGFSSEPSSIFKECHDKKLAEYNEDRMKRKISVAQVDHDLKDIKASDVDYRREEMIVRRDLSNSVGPYRESSFIDPARTDDSSHELPGMMSSHPDEPYRSFAGVDQALESEGVQASEAVVKGAEKDTERVVGDEVSSELDAADATRKEIRATDEALSDI